MNKKLRGIKLLSAVYGELSEQLKGQEVSTQELLEAAQKLIELSKNEYITETETRSHQRHGYFSYNLCTAFEKFQTRVLENERRLIDDPLDQVDVITGFRVIMRGCKEDMLLEEIDG